MKANITQIVSILSLLANCQIDTKLYYCTFNNAFYAMSLILYMKKITEYDDQKRGIPKFDLSTWDSQLGTYITSS